MLLCSEIWNSFRCFLVFQRETTAAVVMAHVIVTIASRSKSIENQNQMAHSLLNGKTLKNLWLLGKFFRREKMLEVRNFVLNFVFILRATWIKISLLFTVNRTQDLSLHLLMCSCSPKTRNTKKMVTYNLQSMVTYHLNSKVLVGMWPWDRWRKVFQNWRKSRFCWFWKTK